MVAAMSPTKPKMSDQKGPPPSPEAATLYLDTSTGRYRIIIQAPGCDDVVLLDFAWEPIGPIITAAIDNNASII